MVISLSKKKRVIRPSIIIGSSLAPSHYQIRWYIVNWTLFSLYEDFSRKYRSKCRLQNDSNFGRAALRRHIGLLCMTILRDPEPMPPFRLPRRVSNLLTHHGLTASPASRPHTAAPPRGRASLSAHPPQQLASRQVLSPQDIWRAARSGALSGAWLLSRIWFIYECLKRLTEYYQRFAYTHMSLLSEQFTYQ